MKRQSIIFSILALALLSTAGIAQDLKNNELHTGTTFRLKSKQSSKAVYQASKAITLTTGFKVEKGQTFKATLADAETVHKTLESHLTITGNAQQHVLKVALKNQVSPQAAQVYLYNDHGGLISNQSMTNQGTTFSMNGQKPGIYIVRYVQGDQVVTRKIYFK
ncbi:hypothetical protein BKI52_15290 [marine bacterium AO1-C]|nr:hypothetical protein BKI52_15290 [marine bacterium AO1-C]